jgi:hypothetical protein
LTGATIHALASPLTTVSIRHWDCFATGINASNVVVGYCELLAQQDDPHNFTLLELRAFVWPGLGHLPVMLPSLPNGSQYVARAINELGQVVGSYQVPGDEFTETVGRTFTWDVALGIRPVDILALRGAALVSCDPAGIDNAGTVFGTCYDPTSGQIEVGFASVAGRTRAIPVSGRVPLLDVVDASGSGLVLGGFQDAVGSHVLVGTKNGMAIVPALEPKPGASYFPIRILDSGALLLTQLDDQGASVGTVVYAGGRFHPVAGASAIAEDIAENGYVVGYTSGDVSIFATLWTPAP